MIKKNMSNDNYQNSDGVSKGTLDIINDDPSRLLWVKKAPIDDQKLTTFDLGNAVHTLILERDKFNDRFSVKPEDANKKSNKNKEILKEFEESLNGRIALSELEYRKSMMMADSALAHPYFRKFYNHIQDPEMSIFNFDSEFGITIKCRPDAPVQINDLHLIFDIKTIDKLSDINRQIIQFRYHVADAHYSAVWENEFGITPSFLFLFISKTIECGRYPVKIVELSEIYKEIGREQRRSDMDAYCKFINNPSEQKKASNNICVVEPPSYLMK